MKLKRFMDDAYQGKTRSKKLDTHKGDIIFGLDDLAERLGDRPTKAEVEMLLPEDDKLILSLISSDPGKKLKHKIIWGYLTSIAADRCGTCSTPLRIQSGDYVGAGLEKGIIVLDSGGDHVGEGMSGGRIFIKGKSGDYLGQDMNGGGIVAGSCRDYAFRNMHTGWGVILGNAGKYTGIGNSGGSIAIRGSAGERSGWLMRSGRLRIHGDAGDYLGLMMSGGEIAVMGIAGRRAGWRMKGGSIKAGSFGPEAGEGGVGGSILGLNS
ncbi:MAG: hypothetical protein ACE14P_02880 [Methanotrichaceae archaeon]